jgi:carbon storage regulator
MLILSRKTGESIVIDGGITLTVVGIKRNEITLGINAAREILIYRGEACQQIPEPVPDL